MTQTTNRPQPGREPAARDPGSLPWLVPGRRAVQPCHQLADDDRAALHVAGFRPGHRQPQHRYPALSDPDRADRAGCAGRARGGAWPLDGEARHLVGRAPERSGAGRQSGRRRPRQPRAFDSGPARSFNPAWVHHWLGRVPDPRCALDAAVPRRDLPVASLAGAARGARRGDPVGARARQRRRLAAPGRALRRRLDRGPAPGRGGGAQCRYRHGHGTAGQPGQALARRQREHPRLAGPGPVTAAAPSPPPPRGSGWRCRSPCSASAPGW